MLLLVVDLLHGLAQVGLELVVGVSRLGDALLEGHVGVVPVRPHLISALGDQIVHLAPEPLTGRPRGYKEQEIETESSSFNPQLRLERHPRVHKLFLNM